MVDAQAEFALEHGAAVVKPSVERAFGVDFAQAVGQAEVEQVFKPLSFDGGTMDFFVPFFGVVAVGIGRGGRTRSMRQTIVLCIGIWGCPVLRR